MGINDMNNIVRDSDNQLRQNESGKAPFEVLLFQDKYNKIKEEMKGKNIDEHSLDGAEMLIKNGLVAYVIANIKDFPSTSHDKIIDLLIRYKACSCLKNNDMAKSFSGSHLRIAYKLFCTGNLDIGNSFNDYSFTKLDIREGEKLRQTGKNTFEYRLDYFKDNTFIRECIIDILKCQGDDFLRNYIFKDVSFDKIKGWLTPEELDKHKEFFDHLEKILSE